MEHIKNPRTSGRGEVSKRDVERMLIRDSIKSLEKRYIPEVRPYWVERRLDLLYDFLRESYEYGN